MTEFPAAPDLDHAPQWLTEAAVGALAWEGRQGSDVPWRTWVHAVWHEDVYVPPDGFESNHLQFRGDPVHLGRWVSPDARPLSKVAPTISLGAPAEALVVLVRGRLCLEGVVPVLPIMLPPNPAWPAPETKKETSTLPRSSAFPVVTAFAMDKEGHLVSIARVADPQQAKKSGLFPAGLPLENVAIPFRESEGFHMSDPWETPRPWMRFALLGNSGMDATRLPAGPLLPMLSRWLGTLCDTIDLYPGDQNAWEEAVKSINTFARYDTWPLLHEDQKTERFLGEWVPQELAERYDLGLFALAFLTAVPAPPVMRDYLATRLSARQKAEVNWALSQHPELLVWTHSDRLF